LLSVSAFVLALVFGLIIVFMMESYGVFSEGEPAEATTPSVETIGPGEPAAEAAAQLAPADQMGESAGAEGQPAETTETQPARTKGVTRVITTLLLAMTFVNVALSALAMAGHDYAKWLNREMPQPLYAQERRLLSVIADGLPAQLKQAMGQDKKIETTIVDLERTRDAGVIIKVSAESKVGSGSSQTLLRQLQNWRIEADRWGRIIKMHREGTPRYIVAEQSSGNGALEADAVLFAEES
jgi:hypothetical protein